MEYFIKILSFCLALIICVANIHAQVSILQKAIDKIETCNNFSYKRILRTVGNGKADTMIYRGNSTFITMPNDTNYGYYFKNDLEKMTFVYNGQRVVTNINYNDSSYEFIEPSKYSLIYCIPSFINRLKKVLNNTSIIIQENDTVINSIPCYHYIEKDVDSVKNNNKDFEHTHFFIEKKSKNINKIIYTWKYTAANKTVMVNYMEFNYSDYKFNKNDLDLSVTIPANFHQTKEQSLKLLEAGVNAPDWTLYSTEGNKLSLSGLKGKIVLIDFSYVGCLPCMEAIKPMNNLEAKYKDKDVAIVSIYPIDNNEVVKKYIEEYGIKYPIYIDRNTLPAKYQITGYPCFYVIDKDGKIANVFTGYSDDFMTKTSSIIDSLLNKN